MRFGIPLAYLALLTMAVPWFWPAGHHGLLFGMPLWVCVAIAVSAMVSILTAWLLSKPWPDEEGSGDE